LSYSPIFINNFGEFKNSDKLLDNCVELYINYCIFNDIEIKEKRKIRGSFHIYHHLLLRNKTISEKKIKINKFTSKF
jgi:hypothetical protein